MSLYVCQFSSGHVKVGRSIDPVARIASHADRVACLGVELLEHAVFDCSDTPARESLLVERCASAASRRLQYEWFEGLEYAAVCAWAQEIAAAPAEGLDPRLGAIDRAVSILGSQKALGAFLGVSKASVSHWAVGVRRVPVEHCPLIERATDRKVRCEELRPDVDWGFLRTFHGAAPQD